MKINTGASGLLMSVIEIVIGILLLVNPVGFTSGIIIALGIASTAIGIAHVIRYFRSDAQTAAMNGNLTKGILLSAFGLLCALKSELLIATFPIITILYGILILAAGVSKLQNAIDMLRLDRKYWFVALISAILTLLFAILIITNPFTSTAVLWTFIGVSLIIEAVLDVLTFVFAAKS